MVSSVAVVIFAVAGVGLKKALDSVMVGLFLVLMGVLMLILEVVERMGVALLMLMFESVLEGRKQLLKLIFVVAGVILGCVVLLY